MCDIRDRDRLYGEEEICLLLKKAEQLGFTLGKGCDLERISIADLERLVMVIQ